MEKFGKLIVSLCMIIFKLLLNGFILSTLWSWFIVDIFGVSEISLLHGMGLYTVYIFLAAKLMEFDIGKEQRTFSKILKDQLTHTVVSLLILSQGFIITLFI